MNEFQIPFEVLCLLQELSTGGGVFHPDAEKRLETYWEVPSGQKVIDRATSLGLVEHYFVGDDHCLRLHEDFPFRLVLHPSNVQTFLLWAERQQPSFYLGKPGHSWVAGYGLWLHVRGTKAISRQPEELRAAINSLASYNHERKPWVLYILDSADRFVVVGEYESRTHLGMLLMDQPRIQWLSWASEAGQKVKADLTAMGYSPKVVEPANQQKDQVAP